MKRQSLLSGAFALTASGIVVKGLGWLYRIALPRLLGGGEVGAYGVGVFGVAVTLYQIVGLATSSGIPIATSATLARLNDVRARTELIRSVSDAVSVSAVIVAAAIALSAFLVGSSYGTGAGLGCLLVAPAVVFSARTGLYSGIFESRTFMVPRAVAQVAEQAIRVLVILTVAILLAEFDTELAGGGAVLGFSVGAGASLLYMQRVGKRHDISLSRLRDVAERIGGSLFRRPSPTVRKYLRLVGLVAASGAIVPVLNLVDMWVIPLRARSLALSSEVATLSFGVVTQMALPVVVAPAVLTSGLTATMVPKVAGRAARNRASGGDHVVLRSLAFGVWALLPAAMLLYQFGSELASLFWEYAQAGEVIGILAWSIPFYGAFQVASGAAQARGRPATPAIAVLLACVLKAALDWILIGSTSDLAHAVAYSTLVALVFATAICMTTALVWRDSVRSWIGIQTIRFLLPTAILAAALWIVAKHLSPEAPIRQGAVTACAVGAYVGLSFATGAVRRRELARVPLLSSVLRK